MGRLLPDEVVYRIRICIEANEYVGAIAAVVKVAKKTVYKMQLNLNIWGEPYVVLSVRSLALAGLNRFVSCMVHHATIAEWHPNRKSAATQLCLYAYFCSLATV